MNWKRTWLGAVAFSFATAAFGQAGFQELFVTNNTTGNITAFKVNSDGTLTQIGIYAAGTNPQDIVVSADGKNVVVVNATAATIEQIYTFTVQSDGTLIRSEPPSTVGDGPLAMAITRNNVVLVPSATDDRLNSYFLAGNNTSFVNFQAAGTFPVMVGCSPDGSIAFCSGSGDSGVRSYSIAGNGALTAVDTFASGGTPFGISVHPTLPQIYVSMGLGNVIKRFSYNAAGNLTFLGDASSGGGNSAVESALHPNGTYLYQCHVVSDSLTVLPINPDGSLGTVIDTEPIGSDIRSVICDGKYVFVTDESSISAPVGIVVFKIENDGTLTRLTPGAAIPTGGGRPQFMAMWIPPSSSVPTSYTVNFGIETTVPGVARLAQQDGSTVQLCQNLDQEDPAPVQLEVQGTFPNNSPANLTLDVVAAAEANDREIYVEMFSYALSDWVGSPSVPVTDSLALYSFGAPGTASNFVRNSDGQVLARITGFLGAADQPSLPCFDFDKFAWR